MGQNRDTTKALAAIKDKSKLAKRKEAATLLLEASYPKRIQLSKLNEMLAADGLGSIGAGTIGKIWRRLEKAAAKAERAKARANGHADVKPAPVVLDSTPRVVGYVQSRDGALLPVWRHE